MEATQTKIARLLRAQTDSVYANQLKIQSLGPEHLAHQRQLRRSLAEVEKNTGKIESTVSVIKARTVGVRGQSEVKVPTIGNISMAIGKITRVAQSRALEVDELQKMFVDISINNSIGASHGSGNAGGSPRSPASLRSPRSTRQVTPGSSPRKRGDRDSRESDGHASYSSLQKMNEALKTCLEGRKCLKTVIGHN